MSLSQTLMSEPEVWLRGSVPAVAPLLQPVAHSLLQCRNEISAALPAMSPAQLWAQRNGAASAGFHARHAMGSLDRLFTYARGESLSPLQLSAMAREGIADTTDEIQQRLAEEFSAAIERALDQLRATPEASLLQARAVGRAQLPSTVIGLLFHAAEHTQRHVGQLVTTAKLVQDLPTTH